MTHQVASKVYVRDINQTLAKSRRSLTLRLSDSVFYKSLKPEIFHRQDGIFGEITRLLLKLETSRVCILGWEASSVALLSKSCIPNYR